MNKLILIVVLISNFSMAQSNDHVLNKFLLEDELEHQNLIDNFKKYDFSKIWVTAQNLSVLGIIGKEHQRLKIKIIEVSKNKNSQIEYFVKGKSCVKGLICDFSGIITLTEIKKIKALHYGIDNEYEDKGIKSQGILVGEYQFNENIEQEHSGIFTGQLYSRWFLDAEDHMKYDDIEIYSDGYMNNAFIGVWRKHNSPLTKPCNWGDFRILKCNEDFDIGAGEFSPNDNYLEYGWAIRRGAMEGNKEAIRRETEKWWE